MSDPVARPPSHIGSYVRIALGRARTEGSPGLAPARTSPIRSSMCSPSIP